MKSKALSAGSDADGGYLAPPQLESDTGALLRDVSPIAAKTWTWGNIGFVPSGAAGALTATDPAAALIDLVYALRAPYRLGARWVMNRLTQGTIRKLKDGQGNYLWQPAFGAGAPPTLLSLPVTECDEMPDTDIAAGSFALDVRCVDLIDGTIADDGNA